MISGYLITSIIVREIQSSSFTFTKFYIRRIRRILPAFYAVGFATIAASYFLLLPAEYKQFTNSFFAASVFASNLFFLLKSGGYFAENAADMPFLHTWSLAVEEQFYVIWPVALLVLSRWVPAKVLIPLTVATIALSFGIGEWGTRYYPEFAYYMLPGRIGELLMGALLAFAPKLGSGLNITSRNLVSIAGLVLLIASSLVLTDQSSFPGINAFWPCLGVVLLIVSGEQAVVNKKLLSIRPMVFVGLISYSLYLWHWPLVAFVNYFEIDKTLEISSAIVLASLVLAIISWKFIEQPFRHIKLSPPKMWFSTLAALVCISLVVSLLVRSNQGFESRFFVKGWKNREATVSPKNCLSASPQDYPERCLLGKQGAEPTFVIWGDSHADTMVQTISEYASTQGAAGLAFIKHSCPSVAGTLRVGPSAGLGKNFVSECAAYTDAAFEYLQKNTSVETVILNSAYNWYMRASTEDGIPILIKKDTGEGHGKVVLALVETANKLVSSGKKVIIVMPHYTLAKPRAAIVKHDTFGMSGTLSMSFAQAATYHEKLDALLDKYNLDQTVHRVYPSTYLCHDQDVCRYIDASGNLFVSDGSHLSKIAAEKIVSSFSHLLL